MLFCSGNPKNPGVPTEPQSTRRSDQGPPPPRPGLGPFKLRFPPLHDRTLSPFSGRQAVSWATFTSTPQVPPHLNDHPLPSSLGKWPRCNDFQESCWTCDCLEIQHRDAPGSSVQPFSPVKLSFPRDSALGWEPKALSFFQSRSVYFKAQRQWEQPAARGTLDQEHPSREWRIASREPGTQVQGRRRCISFIRTVLSPRFQTLSSLSASPSLPGALGFRVQP